MERSKFKSMKTKIEQLKKRSPWIAQLLTHCLVSKDPRAFAALKMMLTRLKPHVA